MERDSRLSKALFLATLHGDIENVEWLISIGAHTNTTNYLGNTPLHVACDRGYTECVKTLIKNGADVKATNNYGDTPKYWASKRAHADIVKLLDKNICDRKYNVDVNGLTLSCRNSSATHRLDRAQPKPLRKVPAYMMTAFKDLSDPMIALPCEVVFEETWTNDIPYMRQEAKKRSSSKSLVRTPTLLVKTSSLKKPVSSRDRETKPALLHKYSNTRWSLKINQNTIKNLEGQLYAANDYNPFGEGDRPTRVNPKVELKKPLIKPEEIVAKKMLLKQVASIKSDTNKASSSELQQNEVALSKPQRQENSGPRLNINEAASSIPQWNQTVSKEMVRVNETTSPKTLAVKTLVLEAQVHEPAKRNKSLQQ